MGPPRSSEILRESLYRGADDVILLSDRAFAGADTLATAKTLSKAIQKVDAYDFIFCGRQAIDGDTAQVGPQVAAHLNIPHVTFIDNIEKIEDNRSEEHTSELQSHSFISYAVFCLKKKNNNHHTYYSVLFN